ncbi:hypothetical protein M422DRAFT_238469 [Sphaerobolus stellatus SS14]|nr:hypothetical protein M422DRAFT_238469 [Sphaerobolus stellatus SS14]
MSTIPEGRRVAKRDTEDEESSDSEQEQENLNASDHDSDDSEPTVRQLLAIDSDSGVRSPSPRQIRDSHIGALDYSCFTFEKDRSRLYTTYRYDYYMYCTNVFLLDIAADKEFFGKEHTIELVAKWADICTTMVEPVSGNGRSLPSICITLGGSMHIGVLDPTQTGPTPNYPYISRTLPSPPSLPNMLEMNIKLGQKGFRIAIEYLYDVFMAAYITALEGLLKYPGYPANNSQIGNKHV